MRFDLTILGSNSAIPAHGRHPSAHFFVCQEEQFLIDCGEGTQLQISRYHVKRSKIKAIFISHLHGDHFFGLIGLLTSMSLGGHQKHVSVFSPPGLAPIIQMQLDASGTVLSFPLSMVEIDIGNFHKIYETESIEVFSFPLEHRVPVSGFLFKEKKGMFSVDPSQLRAYKVPVNKIKEIKKGADFLTPEGELVKNEVFTLPPPPPRSFAYCSDTRFTETIIPYIKGVDLLYHEATFTDAHKAQAAVTMHSTAREAAEIARLAGVRKLILGHFSSRYRELETLLGEAITVFPESYLAFEGYKFEVPSEGARGKIA